MIEITNSILLGISAYRNVTSTQISLITVMLSIKYWPISHLDNLIGIDVLFPSTKSVWLFN